MGGNQQSSHPVSFDNEKPYEASAASIGRQNPVADTSKMITDDRWLPLTDKQQVQEELERRVDSSPFAGISGNMCRLLLS